MIKKKKNYVLPRNRLHYTSTSAKKFVKGVQDERKLFVIFAFLCGKFQLSRFNESNSQETFQNFETSFKHK